MGRPSKYNEEIAEKICEQIALGRSLVAICRDDGGVPNYSTVMRWLKEHDQFRESYERAREDQADFLADEIIELADTCREGQKRTQKADGSIEIVMGDMVERTRLQIEARKWTAMKLKPKKYGDRQQIEHSSDAENPVQVVIRHVGATGNITDK